MKSKDKKAHSVIASLPRSARRAIARHNMENAGVEKINQTHMDGKSWFSMYWKQFVKAK